MQKPHPLRKVSLLSGLRKEQDGSKGTPHAEGSNSLAGTASDNDACFNMVNFILGAGVLGYPFCYKACGLALTTLLILICLIAAQLSMRLLLFSSHISGKRTYEDLARLCFGKTGQRVMGTCVFMLNMGALVAYVNILADVLSSVAGSIIPPGAEPSRNMVMTGQHMAGFGYAPAFSAKPVTSIQVVLTAFFCISQTCSPGGCYALHMLPHTSPNTIATHKAATKGVDSGITLCGALPVALLVKSPAVLALVSQASVSFVFFFAIVVAALSMSPAHSHGKLTCSRCLTYDLHHLAIWHIT